MINKQIKTSSQDRPEENNVLGCGSDKLLKHPHYGGDRMGASLRKVLCKHDGLRSGVDPLCTPAALASGVLLDVVQHIEIEKSLLITVGSSACLIVLLCSSFSVLSTAALRFQNATERVRSLTRTRARVMWRQCGSDSALECPAVAVAVPLMRLGDRVESCQIQHRVPLPHPYTPVPPPLVGSATDLVALLPALNKQQAHPRTQEPTNPLPLELQLDSSDRVGSFKLAVSSQNLEGGEAKSQRLYHTVCLATVCTAKLRLARPGQTRCMKPPGLWSCYRAGFPRSRSAISPPMTCHAPFGFNI